MTANDFRASIADMADAEVIGTFADALDSLGALDAAADELATLVAVGYPYNGVDIRQRLVELITAAYDTANPPG